MAVPADQIPVGEGLHPDGRPGASFFVARQMVDALEERGPEWKQDDGRFVHETIKEPDAIFEGPQRIGDQDVLYYSVRPSRDPEDADNPTLPRFGYVFVVYVRAGTWGYVIFDWEWRQEDGETPGHPLNWQTSFARRTWSKT